MLFYMYALKRFGKQLWKEPNTVMCASILMTLLGLPVLTIGIALCAGVAYMYAKEKGIETSFRMALREIRPCAGKALGGTMAGYDLLGQLGHSRTALPALWLRSAASRGSWIRINWRWGWAARCCCICCCSIFPRPCSAIRF